MRLGINRAEASYISESDKKNVPCVFLSHISLDKPMVKDIGDYIKKAGIDIYLDVNDTILQSAVIRQDDKKITECIQIGLNNSTHILCLLSPDTVKSWWVPYEIGFGEKGSKDISTMKLKVLPDSNVPSFLKCRRYLKGRQDLNNYVEEINRRLGNTIIKCASANESAYKSVNYTAILEKSVTNHPLSAYLDD